MPRVATGRFGERAGQILESRSEVISKPSQLHGTARRQNKKNDCNKEFTKMSINIEQSSYLAKLATLIYLYLGLSLPLPAARRAAEADLGGWHAEQREYVHSSK
jgi:hypothetical protein